MAFPTWLRFIEIIFYIQYFQNTGLTKTCLNTCWMNTMTYKSVRWVTEQEILKSMLYLLLQEIREGIGNWVSIFLHSFSLSVGFWKRRENVGKYDWLYILYWSINFACFWSWLKILQEGIFFSLRMNCIFTKSYLSRTFQNEISKSGWGKSVKYFYGKHWEWPDKRIKMEEVVRMR